MAQYREGSITLSFGTASVTGTGTRWLSNIKPHDMLVAGSNGPAAFVASVVSDTELLLEQPWPSPDTVATTYAIHRDFDPTTGAPLLSAGDTGVHLLVNRAIARLSMQTAPAVAGFTAVQDARFARDEAQASAAAAAADRTTVAAHKADVTAAAAIVAADKQATVTAREAALAGAAGISADRSAVAGDRAAVLTDRAAVESALSQAQALVGSAGTGAATGLAYAALTRSLVTATDVVAVHLYDTRLDSDGGVWTDRPGGSWYWEALNTATRGPSRRFPKVALIVARAASVTIYDAHDLDAGGTPRMWMVFNSNSTATYALYAGGGVAITGVHACNGRIFVTSNTAGIGGLTEIDFPSDRSQVRRDNDIAYNVCRALNLRNTALSTSGALARLVDDACNSVHARVLPGAPLDSAGLPIPTVAVATAGGVSVIHPWGMIYDITGEAPLSAVNILPDGRLYTQQTGSSNQSLGPIPYSDMTVTAWRSIYTTVVTNPANLPTTWWHPQPHNWQAAFMANVSAFGNVNGLFWRIDERAHISASMVAYCATNYATGWQLGDIRGAWLCDAMAGGISTTGDLINNGDFGGGTAGWSLGAGASQSIIGDEMQLTGTSSYNFTQQTLNTVIGQTYMVIATLRKGTSDASRLSVFSGVDIGDRIVTTASATNVQITFTAQSTTTYVSLTTGSTPGTVFFKSISMRIAFADRSCKGRGLALYGTLSRTALPCGLAAISGFSGSSYLEQQYNPDLDFGTGDFAVAFWSYCADVGASRCVISRGQSSSMSSAGRWSVIHLSGSGDYGFAIGDGVGVKFISGGSVGGASTTWRHCVALRRAGVMELWVDGVRVATEPSTQNVTNASAVLRLGIQPDGTATGFGVAVALARVSAYAPTPAQIRRMWEDERALIIGGTAATLGGVSNNVTALAANDSNGTLAVGTNDGVSVFAGLGRVQYLDGTSGGAAIGNDAITALSASGPHLLIGTSANAGLISDGVIARDRLAPPGPPVPRAAGDPQVITLRGTTTDATPTDLNPRLYVGEREAVTLDLTVQARTYGASSSQGGTYRRLARYIRDAGGNVSLAGAIQTVGADQETTTGMDVTLSIDTGAQTVTPRVTGVAGTRMAWTARIVVTRISEEAFYDRAQ